MGPERPGDVEEAGKGVDLKNELRKLKRSITAAALFSLISSVQFFALILSSVDAVSELNKWRAASRQGCQETGFRSEFFCAQKQKFYETMSESYYRSSLMIGAMAGIVGIVTLFFCVYFVAARGQYHREKQNGMERQMFNTLLPPVKSSKQRSSSEGYFPPVPSPPVLRT